MRILFITLLVMVMNGCKGQDTNYFEVQKVNCNVLGHENTGFKIVLKDAPTTVCSYDPALFKRKSESEILQMVEELLGFQGDTTLCVLKITSYNPLWSQIYTGVKKTYTLQLEALFIINQLCIDRPFNYSPYPLLYDKKNKSYINGAEKDAMSNIYKMYKVWFDEIKDIGLEEARKRNLNPLEDGNYKWY